MTLTKLARRSIGARMVLRIAPVALLGIFLIGASAYYVTKRHFIETVEQDIQTLAFEAAQSAANYLRQRQNDLDALADTPFFANHFNNVEFGLDQEAEAYRREIENYLASFSRRTGAYAALYYLDARDRQMARVEHSRVLAPGGRFFDGGVAAKARSLDPSERYVGPPVVVPGLGAVVFHAKGLYNNAAQYKGAIVLACSLKPVQDVLARLEGASGGPAVLVDEDGREIALSESPPERPKKSWAESGFSTEVPGTGWRIVVAADLTNFLSPLTRIKWISAALIVVCGLVVMALLIVGIRGMTRPIRDLMRATNALARGDLSSRVDAQGEDELATLSRAFNSMIETLERKNRENEGLIENIGRSEARYRTILDSSLDAIIGADAQFNITTWNRGAQRMFGYLPRELVGKPVTQLFSRESADALIKAVADRGFIQNLTAEGVRKDGMPLTLSLTWAGSDAAETPKEWAIVIRDVTQQKKMQTQLIHAEKLSAVGRLISGVAHELNNPLTSVVGYSEMLNSEGGLPDQVRADLGIVHENAIRCRDIVGNLLRFARKEKLKKRNVDVNQVVTSTLKLMEYRLPKTENVLVKCVLATGLPPIRADFQQIEQVLVNLIQNACDAMAGMKREKRIQIETWHKNGEVWLRFSDNGPGISSELRETVFEPFFTTKEEGKGTGLGLAISREILEQHGGVIAVEPVADGIIGTTFVIRFPMETSDDPRHETAAETLPPVARRKILVADDEVDVLSLVRKLLVEEGHDVHTATSGREALDKIGSEPFDLVISDFEMGEVSGFDVHQALQKMTNAPALLLMTGDLLNSRVIERLAHVDVPCLPKPFSIGHFRATVRRILAASQREDPPRPEPS